MRESTFRSAVVAMLRPVCAFSVESVIGSGIPDVCTTVSWIELKVCAVPKRHETSVRVGMRESQRLWHARWRAFGGRSHTLCLVGESWLLHDGYWSSRSLDHCSLAEMRMAAISWWPSTPTAEQLIDGLYRKLPEISLQGETT